MTGPIRDDAFTQGEGEPPRPALPLVSVVVVNFNYGRYLAEAVASVFAQTYPRVECILVDNASTDESATVIAACRARHPGLTVIARATNGGQTAGCLDGLARSRGPYVIFLDADDYLLPPCVERHMRVHLSSRVPVGFTSGDMLQVIDGATVLGTNEAASAYVAGSPADGGLLRPTVAALGDLGLGDPGAADLGQGGPAPAARLVPRDQATWVWAPTSGNCFRRDALDLLCDSEALPSLTTQTDLYLAFGVNSVCGSILVDEPLFAYRLHGANVFSNRAQLQGFLTFDAKRGAGPRATARRLLVDQLIARIERFVPEPWMAPRFFATLRTCDTRVDQPGPWHGGSYAAQAVARHFDHVAAAVGRRAALRFLAGNAPWPLRLRVLVTRRPVPA